jgi:hypothetical protein
VGTQSPWHGAWAKRKSPAISLQIRSIAGLRVRWRRPRGLPFGSSKYATETWLDLAIYRVATAKRQHRIQTPGIPEFSSDHSVTGHMLPGRRGGQSRDVAWTFAEHQCDANWRSTPSIP